MCKSSVPTGSEEQQDNQGGQTEGYKAHMLELMSETWWSNQVGPGHLKDCGLYSE